MADGDAAAIVVPAVWVKSCSTFSVTGKVVVPLLFMSKPPPPEVVALRKTTL
jgi:hypothetical protein